MTEHTVVMEMPRRKDDPQVFRLRCTCGWAAEVTGVEAARAAAVAHSERRSS